MKTSDVINELAEALAIAQGEIQNPVKDSDNPFFKSKYADLATVLDAVRPVFSKHGLSVVQMPFDKDGEIGIATRLMHKSGQWLEDQVSIPLQVKKNAAQEAGTVITYLRRYALAALAGVYQEDNDGNMGASKTDNKPDNAALFNADTLDKFANKMIQALNEDEGHITIGRSNIIDKDLWEATMRGTRNSKGYYSSNEKLRFGENGTKYVEHIQQYATEAEQAATEGQELAVAELIAELDNTTDKNLFWSMIPDATKIFIKDIKEAA